MSYAQQALLGRHYCSNLIETALQHVIYWKPVPNLYIHTCVLLHMKHLCYKPPLYRDQSFPPFYSRAGYRFEAKVYCNSSQLDYYAENPLYEFLRANNIDYYWTYRGFYFLIQRQDEPVTAEYLQMYGRLTEFMTVPKYGYSLPSSRGTVSVMHSGRGSTTMANHTHLATPTLSCPPITVTVSITPEPQIGV